MKSLIVSLFAVFSSLLLPASALAATADWKLEVYTPAASTKTTINFEYKVLSKDANATFAVVLEKDGVQIDSDNITTPYGGSGTFKVNLPKAGTYHFVLTATNSDNTTQSASRSVTVQATPEGAVNVVYVQGASTNSTDGSSSVNGTTVAGNGDLAVADNESGQIGDKAASATKPATSQKGNDSETANNTGLNWQVGLPLLLIGVAAALYWLRGRQLEA